MAEQMKGKSDKYWDCYSVVLACAIVLDPRYKLDFVDYNFKKIESNNTTNILNEVAARSYTIVSTFFRI